MVHGNTNYLLPKKYDYFISLASRLCSFLFFFSIWRFGFFLLAFAVAMLYLGPSLSWGPGNRIGKMQSSGFKVKLFVVLCWCCTNLKQNEV